MKRFLLIFLFIPLGITAQVTADPATFSDRDAVTILFNAAEGSKGLQDYTGDVYAHTGVITSASTGGQDWKYAPIWPDNDAKYKLTSKGNNLWELQISPDIRTYYGVPEGEDILKLAFVFRDATGSRTGKGAGESDLFLNLNEASFTPSEPIVKKRPTGIIDGINYIDDHTVTLLLYAPEKQHIHLLGDFNDWEKDNDYQLFKDGDYWWFTLNDLETDKEYGFQYLVDNSFRIGDAYCEKILDPVHDRDIPESVYPELQTYPAKTEGIVSIFRTGNKQYVWTDTDYKLTAKENLLIYELLVRDFTSEGTINAVRDKLDYLQDLGVNAIELMPIQEFDGNDSWGYNPSFFFATDKAYGTSNDYKDFIAEAHRRGIAVIIDVVFNHATGQHPFAGLYWEAGKPAADNPWFNVDAPHPYSVFNDFNHEYIGTREYFKRVLAYWINEYKVDGFRFDLTKGFTQKQSNEATAGAYDASRVAILKDYNTHIRSQKADAYVILEHFCDNKEELELAEAGMMLWNNVNHAYTQSVSGWNMNADVSQGSYTNRSWEIPALVSYAESHDEERMMYQSLTYGNWTLKGDTLTGLKRAALGASFLLATPGPLMIWQFGELGYGYSINYNGRTGRKPIKWDYVTNPARMELYDTYSKLLHFRTANPEVFSAPAAVQFQTSTQDWPTGRAVRLSHSDMDIVVIGNFLSQETAITAGFTRVGTWKELFTGESLTITDNDLDKAVPVAAHSFKWYYKENETGIDAASVMPPLTIQYDRSAQQLHLLTSSPVEKVTVYALDGTIVAQWNHTSGGSVSHLPTGVYVVQTSSSGKTNQAKFVKN